MPCLFCLFSGGVDRSSLLVRPKYLAAAGAAAHVAGRSAARVQTHARSLFALNGSTCCKKEGRFKTTWFGPNL